MQLTIAVPKAAEEIKTKIESKMRPTIVKLAANMYAAVSSDEVTLKYRTYSQISGEKVVEYVLDKSKFTKMYLAAEEKGYSSNELVQDDDYEFTREDTNFCDLNYKSDFILIEDNGFVDEIAQVFKNCIMFSHLDGYVVKRMLWLTVAQFNRVAEAAKKYGLIEMSDEKKEGNKGD